jgi:uncharacterized membrane protein YdjX (TVP38/TMEM64 family)
VSDPTKTASKSAASVLSTQVDLATSSRPPWVNVKVCYLEVNASYTRHTSAAIGQNRTYFVHRPAACCKGLDGVPAKSPLVSPGLAVCFRRLEAAAIFGASFALAAYVVAQKFEVEHLLGVLGPSRYPLAVFIFAIVASAPFSVTDALAIMNGVLFGPWIGSLVNAAGIVVAAIIGYVVAMRTSKLLDIESTVQRLPNWVRHFKIGSPMFLIVVRVIPGLGGTIATQTAAALRVPIWRQIYTMSAIAIPICTALAVGGNALSDYIDNLELRAHAYAERHHVHFPYRHHHEASPLPLDGGRP